MAEHDIVIRGGLVVDGTGAAPFRADVAVKDGLIVAVGEVPGAGDEEIDAAGLIVTPGFVDIHTHYDGQVTWDERLQPSSWHGVTTVLMGNCGVGFAPCKPDDRGLLMRLMEGVEDIPQPVLAEGLPWNWESFPEYLDALAERRFDIDVGAQLPHAALRVFVMGERGANREDANAEDVAEMRRLAADAMRAGAFGFTTSRAYTHKTRDGEPTPTLTAGEDELIGLAMGLKDADKGVLQYVGAPDVPVIKKMMHASGRPLSMTMAQSHAKPDNWIAALERLDDAGAEGLDMRAQVCARPIGLIFGLDLTMNPFSLHPTYREIEHLPLAEKARRLSDPAVRAKLLAEDPIEAEVFDRAALLNFDSMYLMDGTPDYEPTADQSLAALAKARGVRPEEIALDQMLTREGKGTLYVTFANYAEHTLDPALAMIRHPRTLSGLSDGGAHVGMICDGSFPTFLLTHWTRDRTRGEKMDLAEVIKLQTADTADWIGLADRGRLQPGLRADINVIDHAGLKLLAPEVQHDLPAGGRRLVQRAEGYVATLVNGVVTYRGGEPTGALPGRLVRAA